jgi:hypothetical protein
VTPDKVLLAVALSTFRRLTPAERQGLEGCSPEALIIPELGDYSMLVDEDHVHLINEKDMTETIYILKEA